MSARPPQRLRIELDRADESEFVGMGSIFTHAFATEYPKLSQAMYAGHYPDTALTDTLEKHPPSEFNKCVIAFDTREDYDEDMSYGWISVGLVCQGANLNSYAASDLSVYLSLKMLATEARDRGDDPRQLNVNDPRVRLSDELRERSADGQCRFIADPHMVINTLALWPDTHSDSIWEMALKLLGWAVKHAERHDCPIWTQVLVGQAHFFRQAGFAEIGAFTLNLNNYTLSNTTDLGTQRWVQMVYSGPRER